MGKFLNYIVESTAQPVKTNVLWIKNGIPFYYNKKWKPLFGAGSGGGNYIPLIEGEGENSIVLDYSNNIASNINSVALGYNTTSLNFAETAFGQYNISTKSDSLKNATLFSIGNGTEKEKSNAFEVKYNGDVYVKGIDVPIQNYFKTLADGDYSIISKIENVEEYLNAGINDLNDKVITNTSAITQTAEQITSEVSRVEEYFNGKISETNSTITQTADSILLEVGNNYTTLKGDIQRTESKIEQTSESIALEVESVQKKLQNQINTNKTSILQSSREIDLLARSTETINQKTIQNEANIAINSNSINSKVSQEVFNSYGNSVAEQFTEVNQTIEGIDTTVQSVTGEITTIRQDINGLTVKSNALEADVESLKKQSDGAIDTHFGTEIPTLNNIPAVNWTTSEEKNDHVGDLYYNNISGEAFRFSYNPDDNSYFWVMLSDSALTDALNNIAALQEAVDGKVTIFYTEPKNYKYGDVWFVHRDYTYYKEGSIVTSTNIGQDVIKESFSETDWVDKTKYASTKEVETELTNLNTYIEGSFKDGVLIETEIQQIKEFKKSFELKQSELKESYTILYLSSVALDKDKTSLKSAFENLESYYTNLITAIDSLTTDTISAYNTAYVQYLASLTNYSKVQSEFTNSIQSELSKANDYITDISSDNVITPIEKKQLIEIWRSISEEFATNKNIAVNYKIIDSSGNKRTDIYDTDTYYNTYIAYKNSYDAVSALFSGSTFGLNNLTVSTILSSGNTISKANEKLEAYYSNLKNFSSLISKITIDITDKHEQAIKIANELQEQLSPTDEITTIGKGVVLSSVIGVQSEGILEAVLNASDNVSEASNDKHGKIVFASGIAGSDDWNTASTVIYEDGHIKMNSGEIGDRVSIGNAVIGSFVEGESSLNIINIINKKGEKIPLFTVDVDEEDNILAVGTPYNLYTNRNFIARGYAAGTTATSSGVSGSGTTAIVINQDRYNPDELGVIDITEAFNKFDLSDYATINWVLTRDYITKTELSSYAKSADIAKTYATISSLLELQSLHNALRNEFNALESALNDDVPGKINTWNEIVDFVNEYSGSEDLSTILSKIDGKITSLNTTVKDYETRIDSLEDMWYLENGVVKSRYPMMSKGYAAGATATADGGGGGIINKESIISALQYTPVNPADLGALAYLDGLSYSDVGVTKDVVTSLIGPATYAPYNASGYLPLIGGTIDSRAYTPLIILRRTDNGVAIRFENSNGLLGNLGIAPSDSGAYPIFGNGTTNYTLLHSGNIIESLDDLNNATGSRFFAANFQAANRPNGDVNYAVGLTMLHPSLGRHYQLSFDNVGNLLARSQTADGWQGWKTIAFTDSDITGKSGGIIGQHSTTSAVPSMSTGELSYIYNIHKGINGIFDSNSNANSLLTVSRHSGGYLSQLGFSGNGNLYYRSVNAGEDLVSKSWKTIAFTDSNVASAQALTHSNGTVGATVDASGGICLSTRGILSADGGLALFDYNAGFLSVGYSMRNSYITSIYGNTIRFLVGDATKMLINSSGNVTIGGSDLAGTSAKLFVDGWIATKYGYRTHDSGDYGIWNGGQYSDSLTSVDIAYHATKHVFAIGKVLIGTVTDNGAKLQVAGNFTCSQETRSNIFFFTTNGEDKGWFGSPNNLDASDFVASVYDGNIRFYTNNSERMRITSLGNVGIGTTNPQYKLDVAGTGRLTGELTVEGNASIAAVLNLTRNAGVNYIWANKAGSTIALGVQDAGSRGTTEASLLITASTLFPGYKSGVVSLGSASYRWSTIYGVDGNFSNTIKIGDATISYVNGVLKVDKPFMSKGYVAGATASVSSGGGGVILNKESVIEALGYTPYDSANPNGYITTSALSGYQLSSGLGSLAYKSSLVASDVPDLSGTYLPKSGGIIDGGTDQAPIVLKGTGATLRIGFKKNNAVLGYLGFAETNKPLYLDSAGNGFPLIHSGNVGEYALPLSGGRIGGAINVNGRIILEGGQALQFKNDSAYSTQRLLLPYSGDNYNLNYYDGTDWRRILHSGNIIEVLADLNNATGARFFAGGFQASNRPNTGVNYGAGVTIYDVAIDRRHQLSFDNVGNLFARSQTADGWQPWKPIAFTDSTVAAANKLVTSAGADALLVDNNKHIYTSGYLYSDISGASVSVLDYMSDGSLLLGYGIAVAGLETQIHGKTIKLRGGTSRTIGFVLNESGNVTIGDSDLAPTIPACKFYVDGKIVGKDEINLFQSKSNTRLTHYVTGGVGKIYTYDENDGHCDTYIGRSDGSAIVAKGNGNVGIGTTDPQYKLDVAGNVGITSANGYIDLANGQVKGNATLTIGVIGTLCARIQTSHYSTGYTCPLTINPNGGNVLIGAISDNGARLQVNGNISTTTSIKIGDATLTWDATNGVLKIDKPIMTTGYAAGATATAN